MKLSMCASFLLTLKCEYQHGFLYFLEKLFGTMDQIAFRKVMALVESMLMSMLFSLKEFSVIPIATLHLFMSCLNACASDSRCLCLTSFPGHEASLSPVCVFKYRSEEGQHSNNCLNF